LILHAVGDGADGEVRFLPSSLIQYRVLLNCGLTEALPSVPNMEDEVEHKRHSRQEMPPRKGTREERQVYRLAPVPVQDSRDQDVQRDEREQQVRPGKSKVSFGYRPSAPHHPGNGVPSLQQVHDDQSYEHEANIGVDRVVDVQDRQGGERAGSR
jgi:hypothetical protein